MSNPKDEMEDEGPRFSPPSQEQVAYRALCLHALGIRGELEHAFQLFGDPAAPEAAGIPPRVKALEEWMAGQGVRAYLSANERTCFSTPLGTWRHQDVVDAGWRAECTGVLLWALSMLEGLPPYDRQFGEAEALPQRISANWLDPIGPFLARVRLRPRSEIADARDVAELWHWRAVSTRFERQNWRVAKRHNLPQVRRRAAEIAYERGDIPKPIGNDFPAFGKPFSRLSEQEHSQMESIARERHSALNWLCGYSQDWDSTPTDT